MSSIESTLTDCEMRIGYQFQDRALLKRCLTHSSAAETRLESNERLEFLGDAVLGIVIVEYLYQLYPEQREGQLTQMKSWLVSRTTCARVARQLHVGELVLVGRGLQSLPESILSAVIESLIGGVYLDGGLEAARQFILTSFREELALCQPVDTDNFKSQLQEYTQRVLGRTPEYLLVEETGPDHAREFGVVARVGENVFEIGRGRSKKEAEQQAARNAVLSLLRIESECAAAKAVENISVAIVECEVTDNEVASSKVTVTETDSAMTWNSMSDEFGAGCSEPLESDIVVASSVSDDSRSHE